MFGKALTDRPTVKMEEVAARRNGILGSIIGQVRGIYVRKSKNMHIIPSMYHLTALVLLELAPKLFAVLCGAWRLSFERLSDQKETISNSTGFSQHNQQTQEEVA